MRVWLSLISLCAVPMIVTGAHAQHDGLVPKEGADFSAWRADAEVWGWSKDFKEMAAAALEIKRFPKGKQRGEVFMLVFDVGNPVPKHNVHVLYHTQADMPHDPLPIPDIRDRIWGIDHQYQRMWPRRPKRKWFRGAMKVEPIWEFVEVEEGFCQPMVGFMLSNRGKRAYQPHVPLRLKAPCELLRMTDFRTYWARKDLGACMIRFDYSPSPDNEQSLRYPLATGWKMAHPLKILVRGTGASKSPQLAEMTKKLGSYGSVKTEPGPSSDGKTTVHYREEDRWIAYRVARELHGTLGEQRADGPNLVVELGTGAEEPTAPLEQASPGGIPDPMEDELRRQDELDAALETR